MQNELHKLNKIDLPAPPYFAKTMGYHYGRKWVAFYWSPGGDELEFYDGQQSGTIYWFGWLRFINHQLVQAFLKDYNFGSSENDATHWLLLDRQTRSFFVGLKKDVQHFLDLFNDDISEQIITYPADMAGQYESSLALEGWLDALMRKIFSTTS